jgi:hypothetical protein
MSGEKKPPVRKLSFVKVRRWVAAIFFFFLFLIEMCI